MSSSACFHETHCRATRVLDQNLPSLSLPDVYASVLPDTPTHAPAPGRPRGTAAASYAR